MSYTRIFDKFLHDGLEGVKHYANCHFPNLYSIVVAKNGNLLTRVYITERCEELLSANNLFLWHSHAYDFTEAVLHGSIENIIIGPGSNIPMFQYEISNDNKQIKLIAEKRFDIRKRRTYVAGEGFQMDSYEIHRVVFKPNRTGLFASVVEETRHHNIKPLHVYTDRVIWEVPDIDSLYVEIQENEAKRILEKVMY